MTDLAGDDNARQLALEESAMRARLFARDGINGDLIEAGRAAMRALLPAGDPPKRSPLPKRLGNLTGMTIGGVIVGEKIGNRGASGEAVYEVPCAGCAKVQHRGSSQLGRTLRVGSTVECPSCAQERRRGAQAARSQSLVERVKAGGPVWSTGEVMLLRDLVLADLVSKFGEPVDPDDSMPVPLVTANGWPWSHGDKTKDAWRSIEREYAERLREKEREERRLLKYNFEVGKEAAALLAVVATGDARAMLDVLSEVD
jgi:hypothetical protein